MIQNKVEDMLAEEVLAEKVKAGDKVTVGYKSNKVTFKVKEEPKEESKKEKIEGLKFPN